MISYLQFFDRCNLFAILSIITKLLVLSSNLIRAQTFLSFFCLGTRNQKHIVKCCAGVWGWHKSSSESSLSSLVLNIKKISFLLNFEKNVYSILSFDFIKFLRQNSFNFYAYSLDSNFLEYFLFCYSKI